MELSTLLFRLLTVFVLSLLFGLERQKSHKPVGFGTFIFVATGSCSLSITAYLLNSDNPTPLLGAIITGIGFLGAGALIKTSDKIFGFTTAASIWIFAIIGVTIGVGQYLIGLILFILIWVVILIDRYLAIKGIGSYQQKLTVKIDLKKESNIENILTKNNISNKAIKIERDNELSTKTITYIIEIPRKKILDIDQMIRTEKAIIQYCLE